MKIKLLVVGDTNEPYLKQGINEYIKRIKHYVSFELITIKSVKSGTKINPQLIKEQEAEFILSNIRSNDYLVLLDEKGKEFNSENWANHLQKKMNMGRDIIFLVGGPFGFSNRIYQQADEKMALSQLTFSHQMVRLFFIEQLYRAFTILKGEKYHHQ